MTAVIAWCTHDGHGTASMYLATDSRVSRRNLDGTIGILSDEFKKTYSSNLTPDIFAFCGKVANIEVLISRLIASCCVVRNNKNEGAVGVGYSKSVVDDMNRSFGFFTFKDITLYHGYRFNTLEFGLTRISFSDEIQFTNIQLPSQGGLLRHDGSGERMIERARFDNPETDSKGFSRWYWQSFVLALSPSLDTSCGGPPQLVGLFRKMNGLTFGVRFQDQTFMGGSLFSEHDTHKKLEFRDELFQRVDSAGSLISGAQPHALNFPTTPLFPF